MYEVTIDNFTGPMDLLLHLIKESKMDIMNIKLEIIIDEYLEYIKKMVDMNLDVASSYLVMSTELLEIKSKMLLPKEEKEDDEEDPKERLINRLMLYEQYKNQIDSFKKLESERGSYYTKIPESISNYVEESHEIHADVTLDDLVNALQKYYQRKVDSRPLNTKVTINEISVSSRRHDIKTILKKKKRVSFFELFPVINKEYIVATFLAILEMAKNKELVIRQENNFEDIYCEVV